MLGNRPFAIVFHMINFLQTRKTIFKLSQNLSLRLTRLKFSIVHGENLLTLLSQMCCLFEDSVYLSEYGIFTGA